MFGGRLADRVHAITKFEKNTAEVQAAFGPVRLLTYNLGDGWEKLCRFLDRPIPDMPFPRSNSAEEFNAMFSKKEDE
ncbi:MAG: hypothetical protein KAR22_12915 [Gammaproteobacteria bacterium]|nr:hypothetical protein [Gammaproteobacteria bacterium]